MYFHNSEYCLLLVITKAELNILLYDNEIEDKNKGLK